MWRDRWGEEWILYNSSDVVSQNAVEVDRLHMSRDKNRDSHRPGMSTLPFRLVLHTSILEARQPMLGRAWRARAVLAHSSIVDHNPA